jgi:phage shock protein E
MKSLPAILLMLAATTATAESVTPIANPRIDPRAFLAATLEAMQHRETRRLGEKEFLAMSGTPDTIVLDARSGEKYRELHIDGALNLSFPDITEESLSQLIPDRKTRILIYCNNNFANADSAFPSKLPSASLNLYTYTALYNYGYRNIYELGPLIDARRSKLALVAGR